MMSGIGHCPEGCARITAARLTLLGGELAASKAEKRLVVEMLSREREQLRGAVESLRQVRDYCAGMLAAIDSDPGAADIPGRGELLEDVLRRAGGQ